MNINMLSVKDITEYPEQNVLELRSHFENEVWYIQHVTTLLENTIELSATNQEILVKQEVCVHSHMTFNTHTYDMHLVHKYTYSYPLVRTHIHTCHTCLHIQVHLHTHIHLRIYTLTYRHIPQSCTHTS